MNTLCSVITELLMGLCVCVGSSGFICSVFPPQMEALQARACYWPPVTVPVSCGKSITSWRLSRYWPTLHEPLRSKRDTVAISRKIKVDKGQTMQLMITVAGMLVLRTETPSVCDSASVEDATLPVTTAPPDLFHTFEQTFHLRPVSLHITLNGFTHAAADPRCFLQHTMSADALAAATVHITKDNCLCIFPHVRSPPLPD